MPAGTSSSVGSSAMRDADGTTVWPRSSKKRRKRLRISADLIAVPCPPAQPLCRVPPGALLHVVRHRPGPRPTTRRCVRPRLQPARPALPASTCLPPPTLGVRREPRPLHRKRRRTDASSTSVRLPLGLKVGLHALAHIGLTPVGESAAYAVREGGDLDDGRPERGGEHSGQRRDVG